MAISKYDISVDLGQPGTSHRYMVELVGSNKTVLDVGCATGYLAQTLNAFGNTVSGVEYDPEAAKTAEQHMVRVDVADLDHADLVEIADGRTFDVVVFGDVLEHLRDPIPTLRQSRHLLKPGGYIVISIPNISHGDVRMSLLLGRFQYRNLGLLDNTHLRFFTRATLTELLSDAGFVATEVRTTKAELFTTEIGVQAGEVASETLRQIQADPDATTYQFVLTAVPQDSTDLARRAAWENEEATGIIACLRQELLAQTNMLQAEREAALRQVNQVTTENNQLQAELTDLRDEVAALRVKSTEFEFALEAAELGSGASARSEVEALQSQLSALKNTRTFRWRQQLINRLPGH